MANIKQITDDVNAIRQNSLPNSNFVDKNSIDNLLSQIMIFLEYQATIDRDSIVKNSSFLTCDDSKLDSLGQNTLNLPRLDATQSNGYALIQGSVGISIPDGTSFTSNGQEYLSVGVGTIALHSNNAILSATFSNGIVTVITANEHNISSNTLVDITGFTTTDYNGTGLLVNVIDNYTFTYLKTGIVTSPATGTGTYSHTSSLIYMRSVSNGSATNLQNGDILTIDSSIQDLDDKAYVIYSGITGGSDVESNTLYRQRCIETQSQYKASYNDDYYINTAKKVNGVTRVKVLPTYPFIANVTILFTRDNDYNIFPNPSQIAIVKNAIGCPSDLPSENIIVEAPQPIYYTVTISSLTPNDSATQNMIQSVIANYFNSIDISSEPNQNTIANNILTTKNINGQFATNFSISLTPSGTFGVKSLAILSIVNFA